MSSFFKIKPIWKGNLKKHKKLSEDAALQTGKETIIEPESDNNEAENEVVTFKLKYLGSTVVEKTSDKSTVSTDAVKNIIKTAKAARKQQKKLQRVIVAISATGIAVTDLEGNDIIKVSIYRISNCAADASHRQVFSFISTDQNDTMECHAFFCSKRKLAETVTLTVGKIFTTAYEMWRDSPPNSQLTAVQGSTSSKEEQEEEEEEESPNGQKVSEEKLIDFDSEGVEEDDWEFDGLLTNRNVNGNSQWVSFEDDFSKATVPQLPPRNNLISV
ncbi:low density lipoprotein receptor adapter protein 1-B-like [Anthonomus grandis grandis]|uniref:low density lipoprotein receptor adapter protein 1-B-like n=1 Tax=Anthonomus grandis grandis TaxID=2921223 RepID=UPI0021657008|nr:low density lipoprotein receptor adapter protein 1-B-like [Anthonomus grandis grandis]